VRGHVCHPETVPQFDTRLAAGFRGNGGPLSPFSDRYEPQEVDKMHELTPGGVFFLAAISPLLVVCSLCQRAQLQQKPLSLE